MSVKHTIRSPKGGTVEVNLTRASAVKTNCQECMGWERGGPALCTSHLCPLFPFRPGAPRVGKRRSGGFQPRKMRELEA
jgi:hypothetical protein